MEELLKEVKRKISKRYLGRRGIHGVGILTSESTLCIYLDPGSRLEGTKILHNIEKEATPFKIMLIEEEPPAISLDSSKKGGKQKP